MIPLAVSIGQFNVSSMLVLAFVGNSPYCHIIKVVLASQCYFILGCYRVLELEFCIENI